MTTIASTAIIDKTAQLGEGVIIGPGCVVEGDVIIGDHCELRANVVVMSGTQMGKNNIMHANVVLGDIPQILGLANPKTRLTIGDQNIFRENVTINRGSPHDNGETLIGDHNFFMIGCHVGHDTEVEHHTVIGNYSQIGGHNKIEHHVFLSGFSGSHQFVTIGCFCYTGGLAGVTYDMPPYVKASGHYPCEVRGVNQVGMQRAGIPESSVKAVNNAYRRLYRRRGGRSLSSLVEQMFQEEPLDENVRYLLEFLQRSFKHRFNRYRELFRK